MTAPLIIQRVIPHYRIALFEEIHRRTGARVATADTAPGGTFLNFADPREHGWAVPMPFRFPDPENAFRAQVPLEQILDSCRPSSVIAEFGMRLSSTRELPRARRRGRLSAFAYWTHGWQMERGFSSPVDIAVQQLRLTQLARADALGAYTEEGAQWLQARLPGMPVVPLGNALDIAEMTAAAEAARLIRAGTPQLLAVGRLTEDKRFDAVIEVFRLVRGEHPGAALTIIGDGPKRAELERLAGPDLGRGITFTGALHGEPNLAAHFIGADFLLVPGAAGLSVNHALGYRLPVVAFARAAGGPRHHPEIEYVVDGVSGLLVQPPDVAAMARRISAAVAAGEHLSLRQRLSEASPAPTVDQVAGRFERLFGLLEARPRRAPRPPPLQRQPATAHAPAAARPARRDGERIAFLWENFGPMHDDRCAAVAKHLGGEDAVLGIELYAQSQTYDWRSEPPRGFRKITLYPGEARPAFWAMSQRIVRTCLRERVRVAFLCHYERPEIFSTAVALRALGLRVFVMNDSKFDDYPRYVWREAAKRLGHLPYEGGLAGSRRSADYMRFLGHPPDRIELGYNGISTDRIRRLAETAEDPPFEGRDFLIVARLIPKKDLATAIKAFGIFRKSDELGRRLHICGSGPLAPELAALAEREGVASRVLFHGFEENDVVAQRLKGSLALILPSIEEQFGIVVAEARSVGVPVVVSTNVGARDHLVTSGVDGFIVEPGNADGFAFFMKLISDDQDLHQRMSAASRARSSEGDVSHFVTSVLALCDRQTAVCGRAL